MRSTTRMGLSIITSGLAFVGTANATDLIVNGSFEDGVGTGWTGYFKTYNYSAAYFTGPPIPATEDPGIRYSWRHGAAEGKYDAPCTQTVDLTAAVLADDIDAGKGQYTFSSWLASYGQPGSNPDQPYLTLQFLDENSNQVGSTIIIDRVTGNGFETFADGITTFDNTTHLHDWAHYVRGGLVPTGARSATVGITHSPNAGLSGTPDTYTDLVKLNVEIATVTIPPSIGDVTGSPSGFSTSIDEATNPLNANSLQLKLDGATVTPSSVTKVDHTIKIAYQNGPGVYFPAGSSHTVDISVKDSKGNLTSASRTFQVINYSLLPATAKVTADTSKPGFIWRVHQNTALQSNDNERPEAQLAGRLLDLNTGLPYDNGADPEFVGSANGPAAPADPTWVPLQFEIETVINMSQIPGTKAGAFVPDDGMPGVGKNLDGIAGEIMTYLDLPAGLITMGVNSDDGFRTKGGQPLDAFKSLMLGEYNGGRGAADTIFSFVVPEAGVYPFRTVWEEGGGDANIEWFTVDADGKKVLINDVANGGIPAYRATTTPIPPYVRYVNPAPSRRQLDGVSSSLTLEVVDGSVDQVDDATISIKMDGSDLAVTSSRQGNVVTLTYTSSGLQLPADAHSASLLFKTKGGSTIHADWAFRNLKNIVLPAPKILETFDDYPEDSQPTGWTPWNFTAHNSAGRDITNQKSESYEDWVLVDVAHISAIDGGDPYKITKGQFVEIDGNRVELQNANPPGGTWPEWLMSGNVLYAESDSRSNGDSGGGPNKGQTQFITTAAYDLSSFSDVVMSFSSIYEQNQDSFGAVEYSVDGGVNWLPVMYFLEEPDIKLHADGTVDAVKTFHDANGDTSSWVDNGVAKGGNYGDGIAAPITDALGDYIVPRINDGAVEGKRMEVVRLKQAAGKKDVRLRLASMGTDSWYFAIDNLAFYDLPTGAPRPTLKLTRNGNVIVITFEGTLEESSSPAGPFTPSAEKSPLSLDGPTGTKFYRASR